jgi:hypothetical protein
MSGKLKIDLDFVMISKTKKTMTTLKNCNSPVTQAAANSGLLSFVFEYAKQTL